MHWEERQKKREQLLEWFDQHAKEYGKFERVEMKTSNRPDMHAFMMLENLEPNSTKDLIRSAEHDEIYLSADVEALNLTEQDVIELIRCGIRYEGNGFKMFV